MTDVAKPPSYNNSVPFPAAGPGALLRFRTMDLVALEAAYGDEWLKVISEKLSASSPSMMVACLKAGLKKSDGMEPWGEIDFNDMPFSPWQSREQIMDAIAMAITGKTYAAILKEREVAKTATEEIVEALENPLMGLGVSLEAPSEPDMAPASLKIAS